MSSRQLTPFGGTGEIVTLDNINEYDDLPPLAEIDSPDVYEIRTGALGTDYLVPMQDGSTDFNEWYSLVDGQIIRAIPDSAIARYDAREEEETGSINNIKDQTGTFDLSGNCTVISDGINGNRTFRFDGDANKMTNTDIDVSTGWAIISADQQMESSGSNNAYWSSRPNAGDGFVSLQDDDSDDYNIYRSQSGNDIQVAGQPDQNVSIHTVHGESGGNTIFRKNGSQVSQKSQEDAGLEGIELASGFDVLDELEVDYGEVIILNNPTSEDIEQVESRMHDDWGPITGFGD